MRRLAIYILTGFLFLPTRLPAAQGNSMRTALGIAYPLIHVPTAPISVDTSYSDGFGLLGAILKKLGVDAGLYFSVGGSTYLGPTYHYLWVGDINLLNPSASVFYSREVYGLGLLHVFGQETGPYLRIDLGQGVLTLRQSSGSTVDYGPGAVVGIGYCYGKGTIGIDYSATRYQDIYYQVTSLKIGGLL